MTEYRVLRLDPGWTGYKPDKIEQTLNEEAARGWRVVAMTTIGGEVLVIVEQDRAQRS